MLQHQICPHCKASLDFGERCDCDEQECIDTPRRQAPKKKTPPPPREYNSEAYIRQRWLEFDMR